MISPPFSVLILTRDGERIKKGVCSMTTMEKDIGKRVAAQINRLPELPQETQAYIMGFLAGLAAAVISRPDQQHG